MPGEFAHAKGSVHCKRCPSGFAARNKGAENCQACAPGTFSTAVTAGTTSTTVSHCTKCDIGMYAIDYGSTTCINCSPGQISNIKGASTCSKCLAGYYAPAVRINNVDACYKCGPGTYSAAAGQSSCQKCPKGWEAKLSGLDVCEQCSAGMYIVAGGIGNNTNTNNHHNRCLQCPSNWYQHQTGSEKCMQCSAGRFSVVGSRDDASCVAPLMVDGITPPTIVEMRAQNKTSVFELALTLDMMNSSQKTSFVRVEWSGSNRFHSNEPEYGSTKWSMSALQQQQQTLTLSITTRSSIVQHGLYLRTRFEMLNQGKVSDWSMVVKPWNIAPHCSSTHCCDDEHQYLRVYPQDDATQTELPLYSASGKEIRRCMACPVGAHCRGAVVSTDVVAKWGHWRIPWSETELSNSFIACSGQNDCVGAPEYNYKLVSSNEASDVVYSLAECSTGNDEHVGDGSFCTGMYPVQIKYNVNKGNISDSNMTANQTNTQRIETCQAGRLQGSVLCAVCAPNYIRSRNTCVQCYTNDVRITLFVICLLILIVLKIIYNVCKSKLKKYKAASRDVFRIISKNNVVVNVLRIWCLLTCFFLPLHTQLSISRCCKSTVH